MIKVAITGAGGFIGYHLTRHLVSKGYWVRGIDVKYPEFGDVQAHEFVLLDLRDRQNCLRALTGVDEAYFLAADMGGMGFISQNHSEILHNNTLIDLYSIDAASSLGLDRITYASSACVYPIYRQKNAEVVPLKEEDAYPAEPQDAYGWEKLYTEMLCQRYMEEKGLNAHIVRFHNIFGPQGTWDGGREKAPAALCRKIARAKMSGDREIEIWGDGLQTRSFCYIDDCVEGLEMLMRSEFYQPINIGQDRMVTINQLAHIIADIAGINVTRKHIDGPQGVRGRNSDNSLMQETFGWSPRISLEEGLSRTYRWIEEQVR